MFGKKKAKAAAAGSSEMPGAGWGLRAASVKATGTPMKGDIEVREYRRKKPRHKYLGNDRAAFDKQLSRLQQGYSSSKTLNEFNIDRTLGTGSFGRVLMVVPKGVVGDETDQTKTYMAMKIIGKDRVIKTRQVEHTINEKNILFCMDNRFIVKMFDYFQDSKSIYMLLELINGGEMFTHIQKQKRRKLSIDVTRFFAAETVLAFEYMHNLHIIFRDLKPENMLISSSGHIKVTDFGFAKRVDDRTWTMCGTPEYLAPEIIVNKGYNHAVDWWAVGVLIYEMRCGRSPFEARSQLDMFKKISKRDFKYPSDFTGEERDLIGGLLQVDLTRRLGNMAGGVDEIKAMHYFDSLDWDALRAGTVLSPFASQLRVKGPNDVSEFDSYPEEAVNWQPGKDKHEDTFVGF
jgi:protein kinase A